MERPSPEQQRQWDEDGVVRLEGAVCGEPLALLQAAFARCAEAAKPAWLEGVAQGTAPAAFFDIPDPLAQDELFLELPDHPSWYEFLLRFTAGQVTFLHPQFRTIPPSPLSYVGWHYDVPRDNPLHLKVQLYLDDVTAEGGAFAYVPGSQRPGSGPYPLVRRLESMPGHRVFPGKAGTALLFNSYGMHTSMVNRSGRGRRSIILIYEVCTDRTFDPNRHARFADRLTTPDRRQLFGLERRSPTPAAAGT